MEFLLVLLLVVVAINGESDGVRRCETDEDCRTGFLHRCVDKLCSPPPLENSGPLGTTSRSGGFVCDLSCPFWACPLGICDKILKLNRKLVETQLNTTEQSSDSPTTNKAPNTS